MKTVNVLLAAGADPRIPNNQGDSAIVYAIQEKRFELTERMKEFQNDP